MKTSEQRRADIKALTDKYGSCPSPEEVIVSSKLLCERLVGEHGWTAQDIEEHYGCNGVLAEALAQGFEPGEAMAKNQIPLTDPFEQIPLTDPFEQIRKTGIGPSSVAIREIPLSPVRPCVLESINLTPVEAPQTSETQVDVAQLAKRNPEGVQAEFIYFKPSGKYYSSGMTTVPHALMAELIYPKAIGEHYRKEKKLPGLINGTWHGPFTVTCPYPELITPDDPTQLDTVGKLFDRHGRLIRNSTKVRSVPAEGQTVATYRIGHYRVWRQDSCRLEGDVLFGPDGYRVELEPRNRPG